MGTVTWFCGACLAGVISFYGGPVTDRRGGTLPIDRISEFSCPVLAFYGGDDKGIPAADAQKFDAALTQAGVVHEVIIYAGALHSFFDRTYEQYQQESADAWKRSLAFIDVHTPNRQG